MHTYAQLLGSASFLIVVLFQCFSASGQSVSDRCAHEKADLLHCVRSALDDSIQQHGETKKALGTTLEGYLQELADTPGYGGDISDVETLKKLSIKLKQDDPAGNKDAIAAIDDAVASYDGELRSQISRSSLAAHAAPGTNIYEPFTIQKLAFLQSAKAAFYDRGPFEIDVRGLLASALEAKFFLDLAHGNGDLESLRTEAGILDDIYSRLQSSTYLQVPQRRSQRNSNRFWRASVAFLLDDKKAYIDILKSIVLNSYKTKLDDPQAGHIFIYKVFATPFAINVTNSVDQEQDPKIEIKDPALINRFFNPAQLALVACAFKSDTGLAHIEKVSDAIRGLNFQDYYVLVASAADLGMARQIEGSIRRTIDSDALKAQREELISRLTQQTIPRFEERIKHGAQECGIDDDIRESIYSRFTLEARIIPFHRKSNVLYGGGLNAQQGNSVVEFYKKFVLDAPSMQNVWENRFVSGEVKLFRMKIDE